MNDDPEFDPASNGGPTGRADASGVRHGGLPSRLAVLLAAGGALGLLVNLVHPRAVRFATFAPPRVCGAGAEATGAPTPPAVELLSLTQVASLCGDPRAMVADARSAERFAEGHVAGAIHLPCASSRVAATAALDRLVGKETLVVYGDSTEEALPVAEELRRRGDRPGLRVAVLAGGFPAWSQAGLACSSGPCADCGAHR
jgi:rhodanese-related sulfurtransferase